MHRVTRRRAVRIMAAAAGLPLLIAGVRAAAPKPRFLSWQGKVLGAASELTLWHSDEALARRAILKARHEIERYERIFSLYRDSEVTRLNRDGVVAKPSPELIEVVDASQRLGALSGGAFDITVQPLWRTYEEHFWSRSHVAPDIAARALDVAHTLVDFRRLQAGAKRIELPPGMAITLNGIAQGFITDLVADLLRNEGFDQAVVDLGEWRALGSHPEGRPWRAATRSGEIELNDNALAVSSGAGTPFEPSGQFHHIFDPATGASACALAEVAVIAPRAMIADALATAICVVGEEGAPALLAAYPGARAIVTRTDGSAIPIPRRHPEYLKVTDQMTRNSIS
jgi:thiamine biosynthesis lipoprotein